MTKQEIELLTLQRILCKQQLQNWQQKLLPILTTCLFKGLKNGDRGVKLFSCPCLQA